MKLGPPPVRADRIAMIPACGVFVYDRERGSITSRCCGGVLEGVLPGLIDARDLRHGAGCTVGEMIRASALRKAVFFKFGGLVES